MQKKINTYLHFGYLPLEKNKYPFNLDEVSLIDVSDDQLKIFDKGRVLLKKAITYEIPSKSIVIPLSGGVDSRMILAGLFHSVEKKRLQTVTFGVPGNLDVEIAKKITDKFKIKHLFIDLREVPISEYALLEYVSYNPKPTLLVEAFYNHWVRTIIGKEAVFYSGFIGDRVSGSVSPSLRAIHSFKKAKEIFVANNRYDPTVFLPVLDQSDFFVEDDSIKFLSPYEKIDFRIRQVNMTGPIVLDPNYDIRCPLIDPDWIGFFYSIHPEYRDRQHLFFKMASEDYPDFFSTGVKNFFGAGISSSRAKKSIFRKISYARRIIHRKFPRLPFRDPLFNYTDPYWFYVQNKNTAKMVEKNIADLAKRALLDNDPRIALNKLQDGRMEFANAVELLFNLEIYLKAGSFE